MKYCFICDTPYQLFCIYNIVAALKKEEIDSIDLYIGRNFRNSEKIFDNIDKEILFDNVYKFDSRRGIVRYTELIRYLIRLLTVERKERKELNKIAKEYSPEIITNIFIIKRYLSLIKMSYGYKVKLADQYDILFASYFNPFVKNMSLILPNAHISYFEDGIGSYMNNLFDYVLKYEPDLKFEMANVDVCRFRPKDLYLFRPELCKYKNNISIVPISYVCVNSRQHMERLRQIFGYAKPAIYNNVKIIFLLTYEEDILYMDEKEGWKGCLDRYKNIIEILKRENYEVVYRLHPRQTKFQYMDLKVDDTGMQWELLIPDIITNNSILISLDSTAALMPKMLYNMEPYNILIGQYVYEGIDENKYPKMCENILTDLYTDKHKIIAIKSVDAFIKSLKRICL